VERTLSLLIHGETKVGKSTLGNTAPAPRLIMDAEGGSKFLPGKKVVWNVQTDPPPEYDGSWETCIVTVRQFSDVRRVYDWLNSGKHQFKSLIIDSISEVQKRCVDDIAGTEQMSQQAWGALLRAMESTVREMRDLTTHPTNPLTAVVLIAMSREMNGKMRPYVQGQLSTTMPYFLDVIGFLTVVEVPNQEDPTQPPAKYRKLIVGPNPHFEAGERVQGKLGDEIWHPHVERMIEKIYESEG
jgi:hypothetical protein